jgi:enterobactin synthetase component D
MEALQIPLNNFFIFKQQVDWWSLDQGVIIFCHYVRAEFCDSLFDEYSIPFSEGLYRSVEKRKAEYLAGRYCAKHALQAVGSDVLFIPSGEHREPLWPKGIAGSISHSNEFAVACVSRSSRISGVGIDLEEVVDSDTMHKIQRMILTDRDRELIANLEMSEVHYFSMVFSLKESFFKAAFSQVGSYFDFDAISMVAVDETSCSVRFMI